ncbi:hypothetical protein TALC_01008 [Thermoplasmatales archaeon BRNA1]|nr:hypothetical protein TALC_01008 [Thermoplasmatales archaeon BRNA1]
MAGYAVTSPKRGSFFPLAIVIMAAAVALFAVYTVFLSDEDINEVDFALSSSDIVTDDPEVIILPQYGVDPSVVTWTSSDTSLATVDKGVVTFTGSATAGSTVTITATLEEDVNPVYGSYYSTVRAGTATCTLKVGEPSVGTNVYNLSSENKDYAVIGKAVDDGFSEGLLSLSFNSSGSMVITLAGYDPAWKTLVTDYTGNSSYDWAKIVMAVSHGDTTYTFTYPENVPGSTNAAEAPLAIFPASKMTYGSYGVCFDLYSTDGPFHTYDVRILASFDYVQGNGSMDSTGTVVRQYSWGDYSMTYEFQYAEYETYYAKNLFDFGNICSKYYSGGKSYRNYCEYYDLENLAAGGTIVKNLESQLRGVYVDAGGDISDRYAYANYLAQFVQVCFQYDYDAYIYGVYSKDYVDSTDYWAYPAETIYTGMGDCEDTSILLAALHNAAGYSAGVTLFPGHAIESVALPSCGATLIDGYGIRKDNVTISGAQFDYYGCETTTEYPFDLGLITKSMEVDGKAYDFSATGTADQKEIMLVLKDGKWYAFERVPPTD